MFEDPIYFFIPMILFLGIVTSYEDLKFGKIRNRWIIAGLAYSFLMNIALVIFVKYFVPGQEIRIFYLIELIVSVILAFALGFIMWNIGLWTAGDAKLFGVFSALIPLSIYKYGFVMFISPTNIIINTMVPFFVFYSIYMLFKTSAKDKLYYLLKALQPRQLSMLLLFLFALVWPVRLMIEFFRIPNNYFIIIFYLFVVLYILERILRLKLVYVALLLSVLRIFFDPRVFMLSEAIQLMWMFLGFVFLRFFLLYMGYDMLTKRVDIHLVKKGMIPAQRIYLENGEFKREESLFFSLINYLDAGAKPKKVKYLYGLNAEGLEDEDIKRIKENQKHFKFEHLRIYKTFAFAPYLFLGVLMTIIFRGNMFLVLAYLLL